MPERIFGDWVMTVHFDSSEAVDGVEAVSQASAAHSFSGLYASSGKRLLDFVLTVLMLPLAAPVMAVISLGLMLSGSKPFFTQKRIGKDGRVFRMIKFRTMVDNAEEILADYLASNAEARAEWERDQKLKNDPRVTAFGRFLRKSSLDELPQLLNVLTGDMSLVGPRPMLTSQVEMYPSEVYYSMRPGITGSWQISDRNACEFRGRADYDMRYAKEMSLPVDLSILFSTVFTVIRGTGY